MPQSGAGPMALLVDEEPNSGTSTKYTDRTEFGSLEPPPEIDADHATALSNHCVLDKIFALKRLTLDFY